MYTLQTGVGQIRAVACDPDEKDKLIICLSEANKKLTNQLNTCQSELFKCRQGASNVDAVTAIENATQKEVAALKAEIEKLKGDAQAAAVEAVQQDKNLRTLHHNNTEAWKGDASTLRADIDKLTKANAEVRAKLNEALINKKNTSSLVHELAELCNDFEHDAVQYTKNLAEYKEKEARAVEEIKEWSEKHMLASADISSKDEGIKRLEEHIESLQAQIAQYQEKEARAVEEIKEWSAKHHFASADISSKDEGIKRLEDDIQSLEELVDALKDEKKALFDLHKKTKEELSQQTQRVEQLNSELKATTSGMSGDHKKQVEQLEQIIEKSNTKHQQEVEEVKAEAMKENHELQQQLNETKEFLDATKNIIQQSNKKHEAEVTQFKEVIAQEKESNSVLEVEVQQLKETNYTNGHKLDKYTTQIKDLQRVENEFRAKHIVFVHDIMELTKENLRQTAEHKQQMNEQKMTLERAHAKKILQLQEEHKLERGKMMTEESNDNQEEIKQLKTKIKELNDLNKHNLQRFEIEHARNTGLRNAARLLNPPALRPIIQHGNPIQSKVSKTPQLEGNYKTYAKQVEDSYANFKNLSAELLLDLVTLGLHDALTEKEVENAVKKAVAAVHGADKRRQKEVQINVIRKLCWEFKKLCKETLENTVTGTTANQGKKKEAATRVASFLKTKFLVPENEHKEEDEPVPLGRQEVDSPDDNRESDSSDSPDNGVPSSSSSSSSDENSRGEDEHRRAHGADVPAPHGGLHASSQHPAHELSWSPKLPNGAGDNALPQNIFDKLKPRYAPKTSQSLNGQNGQPRQEETKTADATIPAADGTTPNAGGTTPNAGGQPQQKRVSTKDQWVPVTPNSSDDSSDPEISNLEQVPVRQPRLQANAKTATVFLSDNPYMLSPHVCFEA
jgi:hypothetical protein